jgi:hypothetical protein
MNNAVLLLADMRELIVMGGTNECMNKKRKNQFTKK